VSLKGAMDLAPSLDTCGWFTRDLPTFARVADVLLGTDLAPLPDRVRMLAPRDVWGLLAPEVLAAQAGPRARIEAVLGAAAPVDAVLESFEAMYWGFRYQQGREAWHTDGALIDRFAPPLGPGVKERFAWAREVTQAQYDESAAFRARFKAHLAALLGSDGVLLMPTMPDVAPLVSADEAFLEDYRNQATRISAAPASRASRSCRCRSGRGSARRSASRCSAPPAATAAWCGWPSGSWPRADAGAAPSQAIGSASSSLLTGLRRRKLSRNSAGTWVSCARSTQVRPSAEALRAAASRPSAVEVRAATSQISGR
jgi:hypothetical protein